MVSVSVSKELCIEKSIGFGIEKIWYRKSIGFGIEKIRYRKKYRIRYRKKFGIGKKFRIRFRSDFGYRHTLVPTQGELLSLDSQTWQTGPLLPDNVTLSSSHLTILSEEKVACVFNVHQSSLLSSY